MLEAAIRDNGFVGFFGINRYLWSETGYGPLNMFAPPGDNPNLLAQTVRQRGLELKKATPLICDRVEAKYGKTDSRTVALQIIGAMGEYFNNIAASQIELFDAETQEVRSWRSYNSHACRNIEDITMLVLSDEALISFWEENPEFRSVLEIVREKLIDADTTEAFKEISKEIENLTYQAFQNNRTFFVLFPLDDYYSNSKDSNINEPKLWEADIQLLFALPQEIREKIDILDSTAREKMAKLLHVKTPTAPFLVGNVVIGFGVETLSLAIGQALNYGFEMGLNLLEKKREIFEKTAKFFGSSLTFDDVVLDVLFLFICHERGHKLWWSLPWGESDKTRLFDEIKTDIPSMIAALGGEDRDAIEKTILIMFALNLADIQETSDDDGEASRGYRVGAIFNNKLMIEHMVEVNEDGGCGISSDPNKADLFLNALWNTLINLKSNNRELLDKIRDVVPGQKLTAILSSI